MGMLQSLFRAKEKIRVHHRARPDVGGPFVKLRRMAERFPDYDRDYNLIYAVSGCDFPVEVCEKAKKRGVKIVCHMNSCWHPAYSEEWEEKNRFLRPVHNELADFVVYGSEQAKEGARLWLGPIRESHELIYNAVDVERFVPGERPDHLVILAAGLQNLKHRLVPLIRALPLIREKMPKAELVVAGSLKEGEGIWDCGEVTIREVMEEAGVKDIRFISQYDQSEAPKIYQSASVLVHLKHMDWTPNVVAEAMACGLPIVHMGNGGVPEICGDAGISVDVPTDWHEIQEADPVKVAAAVLAAHEEGEELGARARARAKGDFDIRDWLARHEQIFLELLG